MKQVTSTIAGVKYVYTYDETGRQYSFECVWPERKRFEPLASYLQSQWGNVRDELHARSYRHGGCCAIFALGVITGIDPRTIFQRAVCIGAHLDKTRAKEVRKLHRHRWTGTTCDDETVRAMIGDQWTARRLGFSKNDVIGKTVGQLIKRDPSGTYLITTNDHAFAYVNGCIYDWNNYGTSNKTRIRRVWRIDRK